MKRPAAILGLIALGFLLLGGQPVTAAGSPYTNTLDYGAPSAPLAIVPADLDVQNHIRDTGDVMKAMDAQHGTDCAAPPATHPITSLSDGVFACKNHLMTATSGGPGYSEITLTPNHMADWSSGTTTIQVNVSGQQQNHSDWLELWLIPFADNTTMPINVTDPDGQGPPHNALRFAVNDGAGFGGDEGQVFRYDNFVGTTLTRARSDSLNCPVGDNDACYPAPCGLCLSSATIRTTFEIDISATHIRFGIPSLNVWYTDTDISPLPFSQATVVLAHHAYDPMKHCPTCTGIDTWHWSLLYISNAVAFAINNGIERSIHANNAVEHFVNGGVLARSHLRFSAIGAIQVSYDGGVTWHLAQQQLQQVDNKGHFSSYWDPTPLNVDSANVMFKGGPDGWYTGPWWVRDPSIWT
jgi:hypothetical protein